MIEFVSTITEAISIILIATFTLWGSSCYKGICKAFKFLDKKLDECKKEIEEEQNDEK